ncbi:MAG: hypothetical protein E7581_02460 [Ruminococcaceae bacterium]|nr:hypothetical protein [Oscillospiraceae bacterium]
MKIAEIEKRLTESDCSEETIELFKQALRHVPKANRCQHCYTTAVAMKPKFHKQAIALMEYGLEQYGDSWVDRMRSYHNIAIVFEQNGNYGEALASYRNALLSIDKNVRDSYEAEYAFHMMRMEMHFADFDYTDDLQKYYNIAVQDNEFSQAFQKKAFYRYIAEIIIFTKQEDPDGAKDAYYAATEMLKPNYVGPLTLLLKRKGYSETAGATEETLNFLKKFKRSFKC